MLWRLTTHVPATSRREPVPDRCSLERRNALVLDIDQPLAQQVCGQLLLCQRHQKSPTMTQAQVEAIVKPTAAAPAAGSRLVFDFEHFTDIVWDTDCGACYAPSAATGATTDRLRPPAFAA
jgi:hypothetical protein